MDRTPASASVSPIAFRVVLRGELDLLTAPDADRLLEEAAEDHPGRDLLIDLREVTFADCAGLRPLVRALRRAKEHGGSVTALVGSDRLLRLLDVTRISEVMVVLPVSGNPDCPAGSAIRVPGQEPSRAAEPRSAAARPRSANDGTHRPSGPR